MASFSSIFGFIKDKCNLRQLNSKKNYNLVSGARIRTHDLSIKSLLQRPIDRYLLLNFVNWSPIAKRFNSIDPLQGSKVCETFLKLLARPSVCLFLPVLKQKNVKEKTVLTAAINFL